MSVRKVTYLDEATDTKILDWLAQQRGESAAIRQALRAHVAGLGEPAASEPVITLALLKTALEQALGSPILRQVVEGAVLSALQQAALAVPAVEAETEDWGNDDLVDNFLIE